MASKSNARLAQKLLVIVMVMFGFGFALVPLYDVFCEVTGLNGKTAGKYENAFVEPSVDETRMVSVEFITAVNGNAPIRFYAKQDSQMTTVGKRIVAHFVAENLTDKVIVTQAIPSLSPSLGTDYFHKIECFCFNNQTLQPREKKDMALIYFVDTKIPDQLHKLSLAYTIFDISAS